MKKFAIFALVLVLSAALLVACGCSNSKPADNRPSTLPPTTGATLMPTTEATTMPTTMATTAPTTESTTIPETTDPIGAESGMTEMTTESDNSNGSRSRIPGANGK